MRRALALAIDRDRLTRRVTKAGELPANHLTPDGTALDGNLFFTTDTFPGQAFDGIFYFSGRGLNWDMFGHHPDSADPLGRLTCTPDANGYNTGDPTAVNYFEWCQDHNKPLEANPFGDVASGGPATLPNPNIFANGAWYGGTPYFGPDAALRADTTLRNDANGGGLSGCVTGNTILTAPAGTNPNPNCTNLQPANTQANPPNERGWAFTGGEYVDRVNGFSFLGEAYVASDPEYAARVSVPLAQMLEPDESDLYYVFAIRLADVWSDFVILSRSELDLQSERDS